MVVVRRELCVQPESKPAFIPRPRLIRHTQLKHRHPGLVAGIHESSRNLLTLLLLVTLRLACVTTMVRIIIKGGVCLSACLFFLSVLIMGSRCLEGMSVYLCSSCSFQSSPRTPKTRSSRLPSLSMARISGLFCSVHFVINISLILQQGPYILSACPQNTKAVQSPLV